MYKHNADTTNWNRFYGVDQPLRICFTGNLNPSSLKDLFNISVEGNTIPNYVVAMANYPNEQITDLASTDDAWENQEGVFYAPFYNDRLSPNVVGTAITKMFFGDKLKDFSIFVMGEWQAYNELTYINFINIGYSQSKGQQNITKIINP